MAEVEAYEMNRAWWLLVLFGALSLVFGGLLIFWPGQTLAVVTTIIGLFMIINGLVRFFMGVFSSEVDHCVLMIIVGIVGVVHGIVVMRNPESTIRLIVLIVALFWIIQGMIDFFHGMTHRELPDSGMRVVFGIMSALFGVVVLVWPDISVGIFAVLSGIYFAFFGILEIIAGWTLRKA